MDAICGFIGTASSRKWGGKQWKWLWSWGRRSGIARSAMPNKHGDRGLGSLACWWIYVYLMQRKKQETVLCETNRNSSSFLRIASLSMHQVHTYYTPPGGKREGTAYHPPSSSTILFNMFTKLIRHLRNSLRLSPRPLPWPISSLGHLISVNSPPTFHLILQ